MYNCHLNANHFNGSNIVFFVFFCLWSQHEMEIHPSPFICFLNACYWYFISCKFGMKYDLGTGIHLHIHYRNVLWWYHIFYSSQYFSVFIKVSFFIDTKSWLQKKISQLLETRACCHTILYDSSCILCILGIYEIMHTWW